MAKKVSAPDKEKKFHKTAGLQSKHFVDNHFDGMNSMYNLISIKLINSLITNDNFLYYFFLQFSSYFFMQFRHIYRLVDLDIV